MSDPVVAESKCPFSASEYKHAFKNNKKSQAPVAHAYNPSHLEGRDQKDCKTLSQKNPSQKRAKSDLRCVS
jgi:hypothetical protein